MCILPGTARDMGGARPIIPMYYSTNCELLFPSTLLKQ